MSKIDEFLYGSGEKEVIRAISKMVDDTDLYEYRGRETGEKFAIIPILSSGYIKEYLKERLKKFEELDLTTETAEENKPVEINTGVLEGKHKLEIEDYHLKGKFGTYKIYPERIEYFSIPKPDDIDKKNDIKVESGYVYIIGELGIIELIKKFNKRLDGYIRMIYSVDERISRVMYEEELTKDGKKLKIKQELPVSGYIGDILAIAFKSSDGNTYIMRVIKPKSYEIEENAVEHLEKLLF